MSEESDLAQRKVQVENLLVRKDKMSALKKVLENPPIAGKNDELKEANTQIVESVISVLSDAEVSTAVSELDLEQCDVMMKYAYKLMARSSCCSTILKMHALLVAKAGHGSIVRVMADRKTV